VNSKGQFSIIAALLVAVVLIGTVITTYATLRYSTSQDQPQVLSAIDETNLALEKVLGFTVGYYGSVLQVTGDTSYAKSLTTDYLERSLENLADIKPEWGSVFSLFSLDLSANWFTNSSYSAGQAVVKYDLVGLGIYGMSYNASCRLDVQVSTLLSSSQACLSVFKDGNEPLVNLDEQNFQFYRYSNLTWDFATPSGELTAFSNGTYLIGIPSGIDPSSYVVQVTDTRGIMVAAASFSRITSTMMWNTTTLQGADYIDINTTDVDSSPNKGTQSNFTAQQYGPDDVFDTLTEGFSGTASQDYYPNNFNLIGSTTLVSGTLGALQSDNGVYMRFSSYASDYSTPSTFGYTSIGGYSEDTENYITGSLFSPSSAGQAQSISAYLDLTATPQTFGRTILDSSTASIKNTIRGALFAPSYDGVATSISAYIDVDDTFGNTNQESSYYYGSFVNTLRGSSFTCSDSGSIQSITAYIQCTGFAKNMKAAIYNEGTHTLVATTEEKSVSPGTTWVTFNFATPPSVSEGNSYVLVVWSASSYGYAYLYYSSYGSSNQGHSYSRNYDGWPSPANFGHNSYRYSIYCTYTATPRTVKAAIYSEAHILIASTEEKTVSGDDWVTFNFPDPPTLTAGTNYVLVAWSNSASGAISMRYHTVYWNPGHSLSQTYGAWPSSASFSENNYEYSIYCTYQPSAKVKAAIYSDTHVLIASTEEKTISADGWVTFNFTDPPTVTAGTNYILVVWPENIPGDVLIYYHGGGYSQGHYLYRTYDGNYPSFASFSHENREYSIYCTYASASEYTCEVEFTGTSDTQDWSQLVWAIDSSSTTEGVNVDFALWNYHEGRYASSGEDGYNSAVIGTSDVTTTQTIASNPAYFRDGTGNWKLKFKTVKSTTTQFDVNIDLARYSPEVPNYALDIEEQWTNVNYVYPRQDLCIKTGALASENLMVDVRVGSSWITVFDSLQPNTWNNVSVTAYLSSQNFTIRFRDGSSSDTSQTVWEIDAVLLCPQPDIDVLLSQIDHTMVVELLQNGTMRWLGQNLQLATQEKPIPPIPVKAIHVNQTINGVNQEVPFQVEDWASDYRIPMGLTNNATVFSNRQMIVFLINVNVSKVTIWWNGSDQATQTSLAYTNRYFNDNPSGRTLSNGRLTIQFGTSGFTVTSTVGSVSNTATLMRINAEEDNTDPELAYVIWNGIVRDIVQGEAEWGTDMGGGGAYNCPNVYANIVLTLPAQATYYTYRLRLMFIDSTQDRTITDLCPIKLTTSIDQVQTENGTLGGFPIVVNGTGSFYNFTSGGWTAHHWSQFSSGTQGGGIMFTNASNQQLYVFDSTPPATPTGALKTNNSSKTIELLPVTLRQVQFTYAVDVIWHGAVATFDSTATPIYTMQGTAPTGLWILVEYQPTITVTSES
jgi:hypothetical protein